MALGPHEPGAERDADADRQRRAHIERPALRTNEAVRAGAERERREQAADHVDVRRRVLVATFGKAFPAHQHDRQREREVEQEHPAP